MSPTIRPAIADDIPAIQAVGESAWRNTYPGLVPDGYLDDGFARSWARTGFEQALASPRARVLVAEQNGTIVGVVQLAYNDEGIASLWRLYLLCEARGQGLGQALWQAAIADLPSVIRTFRTSVVRGNPALRFYQRLGFGITHHADSEYVGYQVPLTYLERPAHAINDRPPTDQALVEADYASSELNYNAFMTQAYRSALATLALPPDSHGLDLGCGPGGLLPLLAEKIVPDGRIVGVDASRPHLAAAQQLSLEHGIGEHVRLEWADLARPLPFADAVFDWVWSADVLWPGRGFDPLVAVREAARVVKPGGMIAIWFVAGRRGIFLPGEPTLEDALRLATDTTLYPAAPSSLHPETALGWLRAAGLTDVSLSAHTALAHPPLDPAGRGYLEDYLLAELRRVPREAVPQIDDNSWERWQRMADSSSPAYLFDQPDYYCLQFGMLAIGVVPSWQTT